MIVVNKNEENRQAPELGTAEKNDKIVLKAGANLEETKNNLREEVKQINSDKNPRAFESLSKLVHELEGLEFDLEQLETLERALIISDEELPENIESWSEKEKRNLKHLNTSYKEKFGEAYEPNIKQIDPTGLKQKAIAQVAGTFKDCLYPFAMFGSNAHILAFGEKTNRKPKDSDWVVPIQELANVLSNTKKLKNAENITLTEMTSSDGSKNKCFELRYYLKMSESDTEEISVFFQRTEERNGRVDIGVEQLSLDVYKIEDQEVPVFSQETNRKMYSRSGLQEISLFDYAFFEKKNPCITGKTLKRFGDIGLENDYDFDQLTQILEEDIENANNKEELRVSLERVKRLKDEYDSKDFSGEGLTNKICSDFKIETHCEENAIDILAKEINEDMAKTSAWAQEADQIFESNKNPEEKIKAINEIEERIGPIHQKYEDKKESINKDNKTDFIMYLATRSMEHHFLFKIVLKLDHLREQISKNNQ